MKDVRTLCKKVLMTVIFVADVCRGTPKTASVVRVERSEGNKAAKNNVSPIHQTRSSGSNEGCRLCEATSHPQPLEDDKRSTVLLTQGSQLLGTGTDTRQPQSKPQQARKEVAGRTK